MGDAKSGGGFNVSGAISNVKKRHKDVKNFKEVFTDLADDAGSAWWAGPVKAIKNLTEKSWFKALGPVAGILEFAIGGGSSKSTLPAPLSTEGTVTLNGTLTTENTLYTLIMRVPGSQHVDPANDALSNVLPLYDDPLGVLNVQRAPSFSGTTTTDRTEFFPTGPWNISSSTSATTPLQIVYNTAVFQNADVRATWAPSNHPAEGYVPVSTFNSGWNRSFSGGPADADLYLDLIGGSYFSRIAIKAELTPIGAPAGLEPVTLYKAYSTFANMTLRYVPPSGGGGGGGGGGGPIDPCIICFGFQADPGSNERAISELVGQIEMDKLQRAHVAPRTLEEYIDEYTLILAPYVQRSTDDPAAVLETARRAFDAHLSAIGAESLAPEDL
ncbi:MAG: hypothetical protein AAFY88_29085, partial [Acidobacteriota bacterium]